MTFVFEDPYDNLSSTGHDEKPWHSWRVLLLPFLGEQEFYDAYDFSQPWNGPDNLQLAKLRPDVYHCPVRGAGAESMNTTCVAVIASQTAGPGARYADDRSVSDHSVPTQRAWSVSAL